MRSFVSMHEMVRSNEELARKLLSLEKRYDSQFILVFRALRQLLKSKVRFHKSHRISVNEIEDLIHLC